MATDLVGQPLVQAPPFEPRRLTLEEDRKIRDSGVLDDGPRFEFLEGWIVDKIPRGPEHDAIVQIIQEWLSDHGPKGWKVRVQSAVEATASELEPDIAVVIGSGKRYLGHLPTGDEIGLLIEVAESSLTRDRRKAHLDAEAGIANYWIANLRNRQIEVFRILCRRVRAIEILTSHSATNRLKRSSTTIRSSRSQCRRFLAISTAHSGKA